MKSPTTFLFTAALLLAIAPLLVSAESYSDLFFPGYHVRPAKNWVNDPNGPFRDKKTGLYHLWMQYNPYKAIWGNMSWYHMVSKDLVQWKRLGVSLFNDKPYDIGGVFSGSVTVSPIDGIPYILYTCVDDEMRQRQCMAQPANPNDPLLLNWTKSSRNPIIPNPPMGGNFLNFRDPTTAWIMGHGDDDGKQQQQQQQQNGEMMVAVGAAVNGRGSVVVYKFKPTFDSAAFDHIMYQPKFVYSHMEECPDFFRVPGYASQHVLKTSNEDVYRDYYRLGEYDPAQGVFIPTDTKFFVDFGKYYASKTFYDEIADERVWWGWINEDGYKAASKEQELAWAGAQSLPRLVKYNANFGRLQTPPHPALKQLRQHQDPPLPVKVKVGQKINGGSCAVVLDPYTTTSSPLQQEIVVQVSLSAAAYQTLDNPDAGGFELRIRGDASGAQYTAVRVRLPSAAETAPLNNTDFTGHDIRDVHCSGATEEDRVAFCRKACEDDASCTSWTYVREGHPGSIPPYNYAPRCSLKAYVPPFPPPPGPLAPCCVSAAVRRPLVSVLRGATSGTLGSTSDIHGRATITTQSHPDGATALVSLRVFVDHSFVEVYKDDGLEDISTRLYIPPSSSSSSSSGNGGGGGDKNDRYSNGVQLCGIGTNLATTVEQVEAYTLSSIWVD